MFGQFGQMLGLMRNLPKLKEEVEKLQAKIAQLTADADAGGGMVKVKVNGHMEVLRCEVSEELMTMNDREMLEDLIRGAVNQAIKKVRLLVAEETTKVTSGLGLPAGGMGVPGLS
jgi:DNA-binding YbaB/EbfC family protein